MASVTTLESDCLALDSRIAERAKAVREGREFTSKPDAKPMAPADVSNIEPLTADEIRQLMRRIEISHPSLFAEVAADADEQWGNWDDDDHRWTLTPHATRRINERRRKATAAAK